MTTRHTHRSLSHRLFGLVHAVALRVYGMLKVLCRPMVYAHPRIYRFAVTMREALKELTRPPKIIRHPVNSGPPVREDDALAGPPDPVAPIEGEAGNRESCRIPLPEPENAERFPAWLMAEWRGIHEIEPQLFPEEWLVNHIPEYHVPRSRIAEPYLELRELCGEDVSHVFLVPWLVRGGADLVLLNYVRSLTNQNLARNIVVVATLDADSPWEERLPDRVRFVEFGKRYGDILSPEEQERLLVRLLLQTAPEVIHNINSDLGYRVFLKYGKALGRSSKVFACAFCLDMTEDGKHAGYQIWYLHRCFDILEGVLSDNQSHLEELEEIYALDRNRMFVHYQPAPPVPRKKRFDAEGLNKRELDVLWAGRLDRQKRPDILIEIAEKCRDLPFRFHVYGSMLLDTEIYTEKFEELENLIYHGPFDGLPSLPVERYDLFLHTSQWDGLPNVLLESASLGLPLVASDVGGIREFVEHGKTGFLINPFDDAGRYAECLKRISENRRTLTEMADNAYDLLRSRHSWEAFDKRVRNTPHYVVKRGGIRGDCG